MIVDEMVTRIRFDLDSDSKRVLDGVSRFYSDVQEGAAGLGRSAAYSGDSLQKAWKKTEQFSGKAEKSAAKMQKGLSEVGASASESAKSTDRLADSLKRAALAAFATVSAGAAMKFALGAAEEAKDLKHFSDSLGVNASELALWGSAIKAAGHDFEEFKSNLDGLRKTHGSYSLDDVLQDADILRQVYEEKGLPEAMNQGEAFGYSAGTIRFMVQGSEEILRSLERQRELGNEITNEQVENASRLSTSWSQLWETILNAGQRSVGNIGGEVAPILDRITTEIGHGKTTIDDFARNTGVSLAGLFDGIMGKPGNGERDFARFNNEPVSENARSMDPDIRKRNLDEMGSYVFGRSIGTALDTFSRMILNYDAEKGYHWSPVEAVREGFSKLESFGEPLHEAAQTDWALRQGEKLSNTGDPLRDWFSDYRAHKQDAGTPSGEAPATLDQQPNLVGAAEPAFTVPFGMGNLEPLKSFTQPAEMQSTAVFLPQTGESASEATEAVSAGADLLEAIDLGFLREAVLPTWESNRQEAGLGLTSQVDSSFSGVKIEHQENHFHIDGQGADGHAIADMTASRLYSAMHFDDFGNRGYS